MISIKHKTGNDYFTQWDTQQALVISGELSDPVLHCRVDDTRAMVLPIKDGECTLDDTLLQKRGVLDVWVYDEHRTKRSAQFRVLPKPKPDDYVATPSAAKTWEDLDERVTALEKGGGGGSSADHEAVVANTAARHTHDNKSVLDEITGVVTADNVLNPTHTTDLVQYGAFRAAVPRVQQLGITSATVGQLARIKAVDSNGVPTAWEAVDMPSGGGSGETWTLLGTLDASTADVLQLDFAQPIKKLNFNTQLTDSAGSQYAPSTTIYRTVSLKVEDTWKNLNTLNLGGCSHSYGYKYSLWLNCDTSLPNPKGEIFGTRIGGTATPSALMFVGNSQTYKSGLITGIKFNLVKPDGTENTASGTIEVWGVKA